MKVRLTTCLSGVNGTWNAGDDYECSDGEARSLIAAGYAVAFANPKMERAVKAVPERRAAVRKRAAP